MSIGERTESQNDEYVINTIKTISKQLHSLDALDKNNNTIDSLEQNAKTQEIKQSIVNLVDRLEDKTTTSVYDAVSNVKENNTLVVSEKSGKIFLPYSISDLKAYIEEFPDEYKSLSDVVNQEYIVPIDRFKNEATSRFRETYCLMRDIEMKSIIVSFKKAVEVMFNSKLNPIVICACRSEDELKQYIQCAERGRLDKFKGFKIVFEVSPLKSNNNFQSQFIDKSTKKNSGKHSK